MRLLLNQKVFNKFYAMILGTEKPSIIPEFIDSARDY